MMHTTSTVAATLMNDTQNITLDRGWLITLRDMGIDPEDVLLRARLPLELLHRENSRLTVAEFFGLIDATDRERSAACTSIWAGRKPGAVLTADLRGALQPNACGGGETDRHSQAPCCSHQPDR